MAEAFDAIIIGAGAAGLYCAAQARKRGRNVVVLEHNTNVGAKILISGGGRCNFTNLSANDPARYLSANPHFARSALTRHTQHDVIALVRKHGIPFYEKTLGQLFCDGARSSERIVRMLLDECAGAAIRTNCRVAGVRRGESFIVDTSQGEFEGARLIVATGGLSIPKLGATTFAYRVAEQFNIPVIAPRAGLAPLTFSEIDLAWMRHLSGVSADVRVSIGKDTFREAALFTHRGMSGPAMLQISSHWAPNQYITVDWLPDHDEQMLVRAKRERANIIPKTALATLLPERLAATLAAAHPPRPLGEWSDAALVAFTQRTLKQALLRPHGAEGYAKAEVTVGGIDTNALSQQTMEARAVAGLHFIGEAVDVTGWLGGYNFQWAWSSGWAAAQAI